MHGTVVNAMTAAGSAFVLKGSHYDFPIFWMQDVKEKDESWMTQKVFFGGGAVTAAAIS